MSSLRLDELQRVVASALDTPTLTAVSPHATTMTGGRGNNTATASGLASTPPPPTISIDFHTPSLNASLSPHHRQTHSGGSSTSIVSPMILPESAPDSAHLPVSPMSASSMNYSAFTEHPEPTGATTGGATSSDNPRSSSDSITIEATAGTSIPLETIGESPDESLISPRPASNSQQQSQPIASQEEIQRLIDDVKRTESTTTTVTSTPATSTLPSPSSASFPEASHDPTASTNKPQLAILASPTSVSSIATPIAFSPTSVNSATSVNSSNPLISPVSTNGSTPPLPSDPNQRNELVAALNRAGANATKRASFSGRPQMSGLGLALAANASNNSSPAASVPASTPSPLDEKRAAEVLQTKLAAVEAARLCHMESMRHARERAAARLDKKLDEVAGERRAEELAAQKSQQGAGGKKGSRESSRHATPDIIHYQPTHTPSQLAASTAAAANSHHHTHHSSVFYPDTSNNPNHGGIGGIGRNATPPIDGTAAGTPSSSSATHVHLIAPRGGRPLSMLTQMLQKNLYTTPTNGGGHGSNNNSKNTNSIPEPHSPLTPDSPPLSGTNSTVGSLPMNITNRPKLPSYQPPPAPGARGAHSFVPQKGQFIGSQAMAMPGSQQQQQQGRGSLSSNSNVSLLSTSLPATSSGRNSFSFANGQDKNHSSSNNNTNNHSTTNNNNNPTTISGFGSNQTRSHNNHRNESYGGHGSSSVSANISWLNGGSLNGGSSSHNRSSNNLATIMSTRAQSSSIAQPSSSLSSSIPARRLTMFDDIISGTQKSTRASIGGFGMSDGAGGGGRGGLGVPMGRQMSGSVCSPPSTHAKALGQNLTLVDVLSRPEYRRALRQYLEAQFAAESLDFIEAVEEWELKEQAFTAGQEGFHSDDPNEVIPTLEEMLDSAEEIAETYIDQDAQKQINLDSSTRTSTMNRLAQLRAASLQTPIPTMTSHDRLHFVDLFKSAAEVLYRMLVKDIYIRFQTSPFYAAMLSATVAESLERGDLIKGEGWINSQAFDTIKIQLLEARNLIKNDSTYSFHPTTIDVSVSIDSKEVKIKGGKRQGVGGTSVKWDADTQVEFPLLSTTQYITIVLHEKGKSLGFGRVVVPLQNLAHPFLPVWHKLVSCNSVIGNHNISLGEVKLLISLSQGATMNGEQDENSLSNGLGGGGLQPSSSFGSFPHSSSALTFSSSHHNSHAQRAPQTRFQADGFDLDLTYILDRVIAMSHPLEGVETLTGNGNNMKDLQVFFEKRHRNAYKVYNLCEVTERNTYPASKFYGRVLRIGFPQNRAPLFIQLLEYTSDTLDWLAMHPQNVIVTHCKAGKGRVAVMICAYLLFSGYSASASEAIEYFTNTSGRSITIPSQIRYVQYAAKYLADRKIEEVVPSPSSSTNASDALSPSNNSTTSNGGNNSTPPNELNQVISEKNLNVPLYLTRVVLYNVPSSIQQNKVNFYFEVEVLNSGSAKSLGLPSTESVTIQQFYTSDSKTLAQPEKTVLKNPHTGEEVNWTYNFKDEFMLNGDCHVTFFKHGLLNSDILWSFQFHTAFLQTTKSDAGSTGTVCKLVLPKLQLDKPHKDTEHKIFPSGMEVELWFSSQTWKERNGMNNNSDPNSSNSASSTVSPSASPPAGSRTGSSFSKPTQPNRPPPGVPANTTGASNSRAPSISGLPIGSPQMVSSTSTSTSDRRPSISSDNFGSTRRPSISDSFSTAKRPSGLNLGLNGATASAAAVAGTTGLPQSRGSLSGVAGGANSTSMITVTARSGVAERWLKNASLNAQTAAVVAASIATVNGGGSNVAGGNNAAAAASPSATPAASNTNNNNTTNSIPIDSSDSPANSSTSANTTSSRFPSNSQPNSAANPTTPGTPGTSGMTRAFPSPASSRPFPSPVTPRASIFFNPAFHAFKAAEATATGQPNSVKTPNNLPTAYTASGSPPSLVIGASVVSAAGSSTGSNSPFSTLRPIASSPTSASSTKSATPSRSGSLVGNPAFAAFQQAVQQQQQQQSGSMTPGGSAKDKELHHTPRSSSAGDASSSSAIAARGSLSSSSSTDALRPPSMSLHRRTPSETIAALAANFTPKSPVPKSPIPKSPNSGIPPRKYRTLDTPLLRLDPSSPMSGRDTLNVTSPVAWVVAGEPQSAASSASSARRASASAVAGRIGSAGIVGLASPNTPAQRALSPLPPAAISVTSPLASPTPIPIESTSNASSTSNTHGLPTPQRRGSHFGTVAAGLVLGQSVMSGVGAVQNLWKGSPKSAMSAASPRRTDSEPMDPLALPTSASSSAAAGDQLDSSSTTLLPRRSSSAGSGPVLASPSSRLSSLASAIGSVAVKRFPLFGMGVMGASVFQQHTSSNTQHHHAASSPTSRRGSMKETSTSLMSAPRFLDADGLATRAPASSIDMSTPGALLSTLKNNGAMTRSSSNSIDASSSSSSSAAHPHNTSISSLGRNFNVTHLNSVGFGLIRERAQSIPSLAFDHTGLPPRVTSGTNSRGATPTHGSRTPLHSSGTPSHSARRIKKGHVRSKSTNITKEELQQYGITAASAAAASVDSIDLTKIVIDTPRSAAPQLDPSLSPIAASPIAPIDLASLESPSSRAASASLTRPPPPSPPIPIEPVTELPGISLPTATSTVLSPIIIPIEPVTELPGVSLPTAATATDSVPIPIELEEH